MMIPNIWKNKIHVPNHPPVTEFWICLRNFTKNGILVFQIPSPKEDSPNPWISQSQGENPPCLAQFQVNGSMDLRFPAEIHRSSPCSGALQACAVNAAQCDESSR